jgi:hypothetical protein
MHECRKRGGDTSVDWMATSAVHVTVTGGYTVIFRLYTNALSAWYFEVGL